MTHSINLVETDVYLPMMLRSYCFFKSEASLGIDVLVSVCGFPEMPSQPRPDRVAWVAVSGLGSSMIFRFSQLFLLEDGYG